LNCEYIFLTFFEIGGYTVASAIHELGKSNMPNEDLLAPHRHWIGKHTERQDHISPRLIEQFRATFGHHSTAPRLRLFHRGCFGVCRLMR